MKLRGIHVEARGSSAVPALERLLTDVAPSLGLNWAVLEVDGYLDYASHPEVAEPDPITKRQAKRLAELARANGIQLVPMYNCLGHQSWGRRLGSLLRSHPELNESPDIDTSSDGFYCHSWCPSHPDVNRIVLDLFDELLDAFEANALHVGMDEVFIIGHCPRCRTTPPAELFAKAVHDYHAHLVGRRGVQMQLWGDRLLPRAMGFSHWESSENNTEGAVDLIPTDVLICDWHYHFMEDFPSVRYFLGKGFPVCPAGWKEGDAIKRLIEVARRDATPRMLGYLATTWCGVEQLVVAITGEREPQIAYVPDVVASVRLAAALAKE